MKQSFYLGIGTGVNKHSFLRPSRRFSAAKFAIFMMTSVREAATCGVMTKKIKHINYLNYCIVKIRFNCKLDVLCIHYMAKGGWPLAVFNRFVK